MSDYTPKQPNSEVNSSQEHPLKGFLYLLLTVGVGAFFIFMALGWLTGIVADHISLKGEKEIFNYANYSKLIQKKSPYLDKVLDEILKDHPELIQSLEVGVSCNEDPPNAFALPGGKIIFNKKMFEVLSSKNGLAFVMGHEVGHIVYRHHLKKLGRNLVVGFLVSLVTSQQSDYLSKVLGGIEQFESLSFDRSKEEQADSYSKALLMKAYGHLAGAGELFQYLVDKGQLGWSIMSTHPNSKERLKNLKALSTQNLEELPEDLKKICDQS